MKQSPIGDRTFFVVFLFCLSMVSAIDKYAIDKIRELRQAKGISQSQLAFELEMSTSFIAMIESGKFEKKYNISHLNKIALVLQCSPKDFMPEIPFDK